MKKEIIDEIKSLGKVNSIDIDDYTISIYALIDFYTKEDIRITFDDFDINDCREQQFIVDNLQFLFNNICLIKDSICKAIISYIKKENKLTISTKSFKNSEIELINILFSPDESFGDCCFMFNSIFEQEHALGVVLEKWNVKDVGWGDICFSR